MSRFAHDGSGAPDEGLLVRYRHGELAREETAAVERHVGECEACGAVIAALQEREGRVSAALRAADPPVPDAGEWAGMLETVRAARGRAQVRPRRRPRALMAAGIVLTLFAVGALAPPVRAWVTERWTALVRSGPEARPAAPTDGHADVSFPVDGSALDVVLSMRPARGTLTLRWTDGAVAELSVTDGGREQLEVGKAVIRIRDGAGASASYRLDLPAGVDRVRVRIGDAVPVEHTRAGAAAPVLIDLAGP